MEVTSEKYRYKIIDLCCKYCILIKLNSKNIKTFSYFARARLRLRLCLSNLYFEKILIALIPRFNNG